MSKLERYRVVNDLPTSWLGRAMASIRSFTIGPYTTNSPEIMKLFGSTKTYSSVMVNEDTALTYSAVWGAVDLISADISSLPLKVYKSSPNGGRTEMRDANLYRLLHDAPNSEMSSVAWRSVSQAHILTWGNCYSEIERDQAGRPINLWPITPDRVTPFRSSPNGPLRYRINNSQGGTVVLDEADMIHVHGLGWDGTLGYGVIAKARESLGLGLAAERFGSTFFGNGATFGGVISFKGPKPSEPSRLNTDETLNAKHQGVDRAHKLLALYNDATYSRMGIPPNDAQFLETRVFQVREVARWFRLPPHKLGDLADATFSNVEHQNIDYYSSCLRPWLVNWEQELTRKLVPPLERKIQTIEHVTEGLLRGDAQGRGEFYSKLFSVGAITINEIRQRENLNPIAGGDTPFVPLAMAPLNRVTDIVDAQIASKTQPKEPTPPQNTLPPAPQKTKREEELEADLATARRLTQEALDAKDVAVTGLVSERDALRGSFEHEKESLRQATEQLATWAEREEKLTDEWAAVVADEKAKALAADARADELRTQVATVTAEREAARAVAATQTATIAQLEVDRTEADALTEAIRGELETARAECAGSRDGLAAMRAAARVVVVDAFERLIAREAGRARQAQGTPEKLRGWMLTFYPVQEDYWRAALVPVVKLLAAGGLKDAEDRIAELVLAHLTRSQQQLAAIIAETDAENLAPALEKTLRRWETHRAEHAADALLKRAW